MTGHERLQQLSITIVQLVDGEIDYGLRTRRTRLVRVPFIFILLPWHILLDFAMDGVTTHVGVVLFHLQPVRLGLLLR